MLWRNKRRYLLSLFILTIYSAFIAISAMSSLYDPRPVIFTWLVVTPIAGYLLGMVWKYNLVLQLDEAESRIEKSTDKRKRQAIDDVLRDMSDEDLVRLKHRLEDGMIDDEILYDRMIGDDGELAGRY